MKELDYGDCKPLLTMCPGIDQLLSLACISYNRELNVFNSADKFKKTSQSDIIFFMKLNKLYILYEVQFTCIVKNKTATTDINLSSTAITE